MLVHTKDTDPTFFKTDTSKMNEPVYVFANHVPGSKEHFAMENGYDEEICIDLVSNTANNVLILYIIILRAELALERFKNLCFQKRCVFLCHIMKKIIVVISTMIYLIPMFYLSYELTFCLIAISLIAFMINGYT